MNNLATLFPNSAPIDRVAASVDLRMNWPTVPAKCAVYLLTGPDSANNSADHPFLLATVGNLRAAIQRRLTDIPADIHSKRIQYGQVCTTLHYRIVHSPFAANWWYWNAARTLFLDRYKQMLGFRPAWWIAAEKQSEFPKLRRTETLTDPTLKYAGPIRDKTAAGKLIETVEDLFDLCRYHHILLQTPHGKPCAYKEMGKCPAPCDGSVPLSWYHAQFNSAFTFITGQSRTAWQSAIEAAMKSAAADLNFEQAGRIKQRLTRAAFINADAFSKLAPLENSAWLALQPGKGKPFIEPWLIHPGLNPPVQSLEQFHKKNLTAAAEALFAACQKFAVTPITPPIAPATTEQLSLLAHHLFKGQDDPGLYLRLCDILPAGPQLILDSATQLLTRKVPRKPLPENASDKIEAPLTLSPALPETPPSP